MHLLKRTSRHLLFWLCMGICGALLLSQLAGIMDPISFWPLAFFGLAYPYFLIASVFPLLYWLIRREWWALLPLFCILIGWQNLASTWGLNWWGEEPARSQETVKVMTWNVHGFEEPDGIERSNVRESIVDLISHEQPDVLCLQEFVSHRMPGRNTLDSLRLALHPVFHYFGTFWAEERVQGSGLVIFSKYPIINEGFIPLSARSSNQCIFVDIEKAGQIFRVYTAHLQSIRLTQEDHQALEGLTPTEKKDWVPVRGVAGKLKRAFQNRSRQVKIIQEHMAGSPYPFLITGDFNDTPASYAVHQLSKGMINTFREKGSGFCSTYNGVFPNFQIDFILVQPAFEVLHYEVIEEELSDHFPVKALLRLNN